jgi:subtilisin family serine protease
MGGSRGRSGRRARATAILATAGLIAASFPAVAAAAEREPRGGPPPANPDHAIVVFKERPGRAAEQAVRDAGGRVRLRLGLINGLAVDLPAAAQPALARHPLVDRVEADHALVAFDHAPDSGDLEYENAWGVEHIGSKPVHEAGIRGDGIKVAIIDTGIDYIHDDPDDDPNVVDPEFQLGDNYAGGYDFYNNDTDPFDDNGHGTHVAGILAAQKNGYLVTGVANQAEIYALKVLNAAGEGEYSGLIAALGWAVDHDIDVVNMSLGAHEVSAALQAAVENAFDAGVTMVAASGNTVTLTELFIGCPVAYPAAYPQVLSTTFTNPNDALTGFSCTGPEVDFASPGDQVFSTVPTGTCMFCSPLGYAAQSGTSMASPHLAGTVALLLDAGLADPEGNGFLDDAREVLCATADPGWGVQSAFGSTPITPSDPRYANWFGCGVIDANEAVFSVAPPPPGNQPPVGTDDDATTIEDTAIDIDVLANDSDPDADPLAVTATTDPAHGTASVNVDGSVHYVPDADFSGDDGFDYTVSDGRGGTDLVAVTVHVTPAGDGPVAVDDSLTVAEDTAGSVDVLANDLDGDGDPLSVTAVSDPTHGTATIGAGGSVTYFPDANYAGPDSFTYTTSDGTATDDGAVSVSVTAVNDPPNAVNDVVSTPYQTAVTVTVLANDTDVDGGALSVVSASDPVNGSAAVNANGTITYTPNAGFSGVDAFTYTASDGAGGSDSATVSVTVGAPPPVNVLHVGDLDATASASGRTWSAKVTIRIDSTTHGGLGSAVVSGQWSGGATGTASCTTKNNGTCTVQLSRLAAGVAGVTFTVTSVSRSGWTYDAGANHDPDGSSDGTSILVPRPT